MVDHEYSMMRYAACRDAQRLGLPVKLSADVSAGLRIVG